MTEKVVHTLYIYTYDSPQRAAEDSRMLTLLKFINDHITTISEMGIKMDIRRYTSKQLLTDKLLIKKLQEEKICFPAVKTPAKNYTGFEDIQKLYIVNIENFKKFEHKVEKPVPTSVGGGSGSEQELEDYMRSAITKDDGEDDDSSESLSGGKGLTSKHSAAMQARASQRPSKPIRGVAPLREPDNVKQNRESIQQSISRLSSVRNPQQNEQSGGFRGGGMTDGDEDDADSFKDDQILRKRQEDNEDSLRLNDE